MAFCTNCGKQIPDNVQTCPSCGRPVNSQNTQQNYQQNTQQNYQQGYQQNYQQTAFNAADALNTDDFTAQYDARDIAENKVYAVLAYIGFLFLVPLLARKDSPYARFHTNQGIVLFIAECVASALFGILGRFPIIGVIFSIIGGLFSVLFFVAMIVGIVYAAQGQAKEIPVIGKIKLLK